LLAACCISQYVRGYLLRYDELGNVGYIEAYLNTEEGVIKEEERERLKEGREKRKHYSAKCCTAEKDGSVICTRSKNHIGKPCIMVSSWKQTSSVVNI
jgi:hypothetical protein